MGCDRAEVLPGNPKAYGDAFIIGGEFGFGDIGMGCHWLFFLIQWVANWIGGGIDGGALRGWCGHGRYLLFG